MGAFFKAAIPAFCFNLCRLGARNTESQKGALGHEDHYIRWLRWKIFWQCHIRFSIASHCAQVLVNVFFCCWMLGFLGNPSKTCHRNCCESHLRKPRRQVQDWHHWWSWGKWRSIWNNSYDKWCWATKLWQILSVLAFFKMWSFLHRDSSPVVEVNTVKAISFFFMLCQKGKVKTSWCWMASWESGTQKCLALG